VNLPIFPRQCRSFVNLEILSFLVFSLFPLPFSPFSLHPPPQSCRDFLVRAIPPPPFLLREGTPPPSHQNLVLFFPKLPTLECLCHACSMHGTRFFPHLVVQSFCTVPLSFSIAPFFPIGFFTCARSFRACFFWWSRSRGFLAFPYPSSPNARGKSKSDVSCFHASSFRPPLGTDFIVSHIALIFADLWNVFFSLLRPFSPPASFF